MNVSLICRFYSVKKFHFFVKGCFRKFCSSLPSQLKIRDIHNVEFSILKLVTENSPKNFIHSCAALRNESDASEQEKSTIDPAKDRTKIISPETSIRYLKSEAYKTTYGDEAVWVKYSRNFKGQFVPRFTRKTCIRGGVLTTGNPCPICRDEYLVLHFTNVDLLRQFIQPETGQIFSTRKTHICQKKYFQLEIAIHKAKQFGLLTFEVPFRNYNYNFYYSH